MKISENGLSFIRREEGKRLMAYADVIGVWTIGVGHTGTVDGISITKGMTITAEKSRVLLIADVAKFEAAINRLVKVPLKQHQFDALVSLVFNIGETNFARSTLLKKLNANDFKGAAEQFLAWKNAGGRPVQGLLNRRKREKDMFNGLA